MDEQRITERVDAAGNITERTIERTPVEAQTRSGSGGAFLWIVVVIIAGLIAAYFFSTMAESESRKDEAVAGAANDIGDAAKSVGDSVEKAADKLTK